MSLPSPNPILHEQREAGPAASWPRPRASWGACWEAGGAWWLVLMSGLVTVVCVLLALQHQEVQVMRNERLQISLQDIKDRLETDLALGFDLEDSARAQTLLEDALAQDDSLLAIEVFDVKGISLFNTDRGSIGEPVPRSWLESAQLAHKPGAIWTAGTGTDNTLGLAMHGPFGEVAGFLGVTTVRAARLPWQTLWIAGASGAALASLLAYWSLWLLVRMARTRSDQTTANEASRRLERAQHRLSGILEEWTRKREPDA
jgi:hypothetical protein